MFLNSFLLLPEPVTISQSTLLEEVPEVEGEDMNMDIEEVSGDVVPENFVEMEGDNLLSASSQPSSARLGVGDLVQVRFSKYSIFLDQKSQLLPMGEILVINSVGVHVRLFTATRPLHFTKASIVVKLGSKAAILAAKPDSTLAYQKDDCVVVTNVKKARECMRLLRERGILRTDFGETHGSGRQSSIW